MMSQAGDGSNTTKPDDPNPPDPPDPEPSRNSLDRTPKNSAPIRHLCLYTPPVTGSPLTLGASPSSTGLATRTPPAITVVEYLREEPRTLYIDQHLFPSGLEPGDIVEVSGNANCGKSMLALSLVATALLPDVWCGVRMHGCEAGVLFLDCDQHFSVFQLVNLMYRKVKTQVKLARAAFKQQRKGEAADTTVISNVREVMALMLCTTAALKDKIQDMVQGRLKKFHYIACFESLQFPIALASIDEHLARNSGVCLVIVDSLSAFSWHDWIYQASGKFKDLKKYYDRLLGTLLANVKKYRVALIAIKQVLFLRMCEDARRIIDDEERDENILENDMEEGDGMANMMENEYLGYTWVSSVMCQVIMSKVRVTKSLPSAAVRSEETRNAETNCAVKEELFLAEIIRNRENAKLQFVITEEGIVWRKTA